MITYRQLKVVFLLEDAVSDKGQQFQGHAPQLGEIRAAG